VQQGSRLVSSRAVKRAALGALFVALAVVPVLALNSFATADTGGDPGPAPSTTPRPCLAGRGVTLPSPGPLRTGQMPTVEPPAALPRAAAVCGLAPGRPSPPSGMAGTAGTI
jgi:hypothetical protein